MNCNKLETMACLYLGALKVQNWPKKNMKSIQIAMGGLYPGGKTFHPSRILEVAEQTLFKEPSVKYNYLPRGKLREHDVCIIDRKKFVNKIKKMLGGYPIGYLALDMTKVKQLLN